MNQSKYIVHFIKGDNLVAIHNLETGMYANFCSIEKVKMGYEDNILDDKLYWDKNILTLIPSNIKAQTLPLEVFLLLN